MYNFVGPAESKKTYRALVLRLVCGKNTKEKCFHHCGVLLKGLYWL